MHIDYAATPQPLRRTVHVWPSPGRAAARGTLYHDVSLYVSSYIGERREDGEHALCANMLCSLVCGEKNETNWCRMRHPGNDSHRSTLMCNKPSLINPPSGQLWPRLRTRWASRHGRGEVKSPCVRRGPVLHEADLGRSAGIANLFADALINTTPAHPPTSEP